MSRDIAAHAATLPAKRRVRGGALACAAAAAFSAGCGARTGLLVECETPLARTPAAIVVLVDRGNTTERPGVSGRALHDEQIDALARVLPALDDVALLGAVIYPRYNTDAPLDPCRFHTALGVPLGERRAAAVVDLVRREPGPNGGSPLRRTLPTAVAALRAAGDARTPRFLVVTHLGQVACIDGAPGLNPNVDAVRALAADGIRTLVIGLEPRGSVLGAGWAGEIALAGGLARAGGPPHYYPVTRPDAIAAAFDAAFVRPFWCRLRVAGGAPADAAALALRASPGPTPARDPARRDGWDWVAPDEVEVFGAACDRAARERQSFAFVTRERRCER